MIISDIALWEQERHLMPAAVQRGIEYIRSKDITQWEPGKYELEGSHMFALVQETETKPFLDQRPESHQTYTDIQLLVSGLEKMGVSKLTPGLTPVEDNFERGDIAFYDKARIESESEIVLLPGMYAVFFPSDVHRPCCSVVDNGPIKKVVIKIHRDLLRASV
ncbi:YhcH/YjgK/YiaL family protein [Paenibacillus hexagrammi]|uniref:YhcH/YjgK/YiaL family protein n=1 Tax=Paenibacillus hexagrammi TaxID=2908839 RepID=A0ABY3SEP9_9BACL|nr:YhcH/YjgK/YiaL family protein [Paenibacillus sp. YPD9-1]UJF32467.1 YhcH/YjgK/YiaL family protein [Paenibacillus sp. YPD9-1]